MYLKNLKLANFRNFADLDLEFDRITLLLGDNAQGKSNLLESIYFLATTKSPRAEKDFELIKDGESFTRVEGEIEDTKLEIGMQIRPDGLEGLEKRIKVNGIARRTLDYIGNLIVIYFSPEDINLVTGPPALRRWHIDLTLAQVDREYKNDLTAYHAAISSRNRLLKKIRDGEAKISELEYWTKTELESGQKVTSFRKTFFESLNRGVVHQEFSFTYHENVLSPERLEKYLPREIAAAASLIGPHRDDFTFLLKGKNLAHFGSRGEQRTAVLQLKMSELKFIKDLKGVMPVLLLDDVFSELDDHHRHFVTEVINGTQTILSAVEESQIPKEFLRNIKVVRVEKGCVTSLSQNGQQVGKAGR